MPTTKKPKKISVLLASHVTPTRYNLTLKPDLENFVFEGSETIDIVLDKDVKTITLHSKDIAISTAEIKIGKEIQFADKIEYDTAAETATFTFKKSIKKGKAKLSIVFSGIINENLRGFYRSRYEIDGMTKHLATTQFEATDARRAFPCFDEPAQKAVFDVHLVIPGEHIAISNTLPVRVAEHEGGYKTVSFAPTPKMSTYLLAFIIGEFEYLEGQTSGTNPTLVRVYTTPGKKHQASFALEVAIKSLDFYNQYFNIPYPLDTLDLIAIPDFESAAMENWGAVTFRETAILVDENHTSLSNKQWVAIVIAHELAHQWFGNLVTMKWWTDLWLNEGFASYMEYVCIDALFPQWHVWDLYVADRYTLALKLDALSHSHPIEVTVHHPDEINEVFDMISYSKGSAVIRMLAEYVGHDVFRDGLRHYLKTHSYKNTETVHLWESIEKISKKPVKQMMSNWTKKTGYPLVSLSKTKHTHFAEQERFLSSRVSKNEIKDKTIWNIPIAYESNGEVLKTFMTKKKIPLVGSSIGKLNLGENSFIRTKYDEETLSRLRQEIEKGNLNVKDRLGLIRDVFILAEAGEMNTSTALEFALSYKNETEYIVWSEISSGLARVHNLIIDEKFNDKYKSYAKELFSTITVNIGWDPKENEPHSYVFLRSLALSNSAHYGDEKVIKNAKKLFKERDTNPIRADIRSVVYGIVAANGGEKEWRTFRDLHKTEKMHEEQDRYRRALTQFKDVKLLEKTLTLAMGTEIRNQDTPFIIAMTWSNFYGRDLTWSFVKKNYAEILKIWGSGGHFMSRILAPIGIYKDSKNLKDIQKFFAKNKAPGADRTIEQGIEKINSSIAWIKDDKRDIQKWLEKNYK
ncbi:MAG: M1 family metallopeptidase [Candidatus Pacebacteria bacterium]|nr:M1 family metallopeptidase [Candidatus Paceibacterota bacterium]MBP9715706.1 M1 family metallopeptidase [Candidatus Paceibacterota bacterium]